MDNNDKKDKIDFTGYTYAQLSTLCLQLQGLLNEERNANAKLNATNDALCEKLKLIYNILQ